MINMSFTMLGVYLMYAGQMSGGSLSATGSTNLPPIDHGSHMSDADVEETNLLLQLRAKDESVEDYEEVVWMQQASGQTPALRTPIQLVGLHGAAAVVHMDPNRPLMEQLANIWPFTHRAAEEVSDLIGVCNPPSAQGFDETVHVDMHIMQFADDHFEQVHTDDRLMLTTIVFVAPSGTHHKRKVTWGPARANQWQILSFFRVQWFCQRPSVLCFVYVNGILLALQDNAVRSLEAGTHLFLRIRSDREDWCEVVHSEMIERNRRVFQSSDEEEAALQEQEEEEQEEEEQEEVDAPAEPAGAGVPSRSRSRSRDDGEESDDRSRSRSRDDGEESDE